LQGVCGSSEPGGTIPARFNGVSLTRGCPALRCRKPVLATHRFERNGYVGNALRGLQQSGCITPPLK
jgi:hypothetical protein